MPPRRRYPSRPRGGLARRRLVWAQRTVSVAAAANNTWVNIDLLQEFKATTGAATAGVTIARTHLWVLPHAPQAGDLFWLGLGVADLDDVTAAFQNAATVRNPKDNPYVDWMFNSRYEYDVNLRLPTPYTEFAGARVDLKSRRRVHHLQQTYVASIVQETVGTVAKTYDLFARSLIMLP